ncbi:MAG TPA: aromatic amino acid ammonia-lyase [Conexibacter sp.]|nr:aromatic amino acid ammonia-lyase [Conexibacter sp.]
MSATTTTTVQLGSAPLTWQEYEAVVYGDASVALAQDAGAAAARATLEERLAAGETVYSVNTGYGAEASLQLPAEKLDRVQVNTLRSMAMSSGEPASEAVVRGAMLLAARAYAQGPPAMGPELLDRFVELLNRRVHPVVPLAGTQSTSDIVQGAHVGLVLIGEGEAWIDGERRPATDAGLAPIALVPKDGGGVVNNHTFTVALAIDALRSAERFVDQAEQVAAMTLQALGGHPDSYDERLIGLNPHPGALAAAAHMRALLDGSELVRAPGRPHDPFSLRGLPQVHGASRDALAHARAVLEVELGAVTDNPVVVEGGRIFSSCNFHGAPIALPLDLVAIAVHEVASLSQRRVAQLIDPLPNVPDVPAKLTPEPNERFGLVQLGNVAAALIGEVAMRTRPVSPDAVTVDVMEDHVTMGALAARKAAEAAALGRRVLAVELACAAQALDFRGVQGASAPARELHAAVRERIAFVDEDRPLRLDLLWELLA